MSNRDDQPSGTWRFSTRPRGEVLAAQADRRGLSLAAFVPSRSRTPREVEGRLLDIIDGAAVAATGDAGPRRVPSLLHHALDGLLRWREELARHGESEPFHVFAAISGEDGILSVACTSGDRPEVELDGEPFDAAWVTALERGGRDVQALTVYAGRRSTARVVWDSGGSDTASGGAVVEAEWRREVAAPDTVHALEQERPGLLPDPTGASEAGIEAEPVHAITTEEAAAGAPLVLGVASEATVPAVAWSMRPGPALAPPSVSPVQEHVGAEGAGGAPIHAAATAVEVETVAEAPSVATGPGGAPPAAEATVDDARDQDRASQHGGSDAAPGAGATVALEDDVPFVIDDDVPAVVHEDAPAALEDDAPIVIDDGVTHAEEAQAAPGIGDDVPPPDDADAPFAGETVVTIEDEEAAADAPAESDAAIEAGEAPEPAHVPRFAPLRPEWPSEQELNRPNRLRRLLPWALGVVVLFAIGWLVGTTGQSDSRTQSPWTRALRAVGLGGAWFDATITSKPAGAWISVDGKELAQRTPATIELKPGTHRVTLALDGLGDATFEVHGAQGEQVPLDASLLGSLVVQSTDPEVPIGVSVDGQSRGYAPLVVSGLDPGTHTVEFSGPGMTPWGTTVEVRIGEEADALARPFESPATGVIEVQAYTAGDGGPVEQKGAAVRVDGKSRGTTPLTLELERGPHSIVATYAGETAPVQVIDLPGGNQRYARFTFGSAGPAPQLTFITGTGPIPTERPYPMSASLSGVRSHDVREMWLHVETPDGSWRRYRMAMLEATGAVVGTVVFPTATLDDKGRAPFYASALTATGDEYFTELQNADSSNRRASTRSSGARTK